MHTVMMRAGYDAHAAGLGFEPRMFQETTNELRGIIRADIQVNKAVGGMTEQLVEEILVLREEGHPCKPMQHGDDVLILRT